MSACTPTLTSPNTDARSCDEDEEGLLHASASEEVLLHMPPSGNDYAFVRFKQSVTYDAAVAACTPMITSPNTGGRPNDDIVVNCMAGCLSKAGQLLCCPVSLFSHSHFTTYSSEVM